MLKKLRVKFVCINMVIVTVMLCVIFSLVIYFTSASLENQSLQMLQSIASEPAQPGRPNDPAGKFLIPYFCVQLSHRGESAEVSGNYYDRYGEDELLAIAQAALATDTQSGILEQYSLRYFKASSPRGTAIAFTDISGEDATMGNLIRTCAFISALSFAAFLVVSLLLALWAVRPVEQAWQQQKQFVADASHELKTPLTVILTNAELLQNQSYTDEERRGFCDSILTMSGQMRSLVERLLELARVDNGSLRTAFTPVELSVLVSGGLLPFEPLYFEKGLSLDAQIEEGIRVRGSASHLKQVLEILLDNAMKYSSAGGAVRVTLKAQGIHSLLSVYSPGEHIPAQELQNIFKRFYRMDKARSRDGSYGLGLSIAQRIVTEHGGRIWAESAGGINGFHVQLPKI